MVKNILVKYNVDKSGLVSARGSVQDISRELGISEKEAEQLAKKFDKVGSSAKQASANSNGPGGFGSMSSMIKGVGTAIVSVGIAEKIFDMGKAAVVSAMDYETLHIAFTNF